IDRAGLLTEAAIDALGHVDVVAGGAAAAVLARFGLDGDRLGGADRLAQLAGDAALLAVRITAQGMLAAEAGRDRVLFIGIVDRRLGLEEIFEGQGVRLDELPEGEGLYVMADAHLTFRSVAGRQRLPTALRRSCRPSGSGRDRRCRASRPARPDRAR